jgi:hypothetical protein
MLNEIRMQYCHPLLFASFNFEVSQIRKIARGITIPFRGQKNQIVGQLEQVFELYF